MVQDAAQKGEENQPLPEEDEDNFVKESSSVTKFARVKNSDQTTSCGTASVEASV